MPARADLKGERFNRLTVVELTDQPPGVKHKKAFWLCRCECGGSAVVSTGNLRSGQVRSCGCLHRERTKAAIEKHGHARVTGETSTYRTWKAMWSRCTNPRHSSWSYYGGRGIAVDPRWESFEVFLADMGERPEGKTFDRIDPDGDYEPLNCRWATRLEQRHNRSEAL